GAADEAGLASAQPALAAPPCHLTYGLGFLSKVFGRGSRDSKLFRSAHLLMSKRILAESLVYADSINDAALLEAFSDDSKQGSIWQRGTTRVAVSTRVCLRIVSGVVNAFARSFWTVLRN